MNKFMALQQKGGNFDPLSISSGTSPKKPEIIELSSSSTKDSIQKNPSVQSLIDRDITIAR